MSSNRLRVGFAIASPRVATSLASYRIETPTKRENRIKLPKKPNPISCLCFSGFFFFAFFLLLSGFLCFFYSLAGQGGRNAIECDVTMRMVATRIGFSCPACSFGLGPEE